ncbi:MAG: DegV family protein [Bacillota bacterium]
MNTIYSFQGTPLLCLLAHSNDPAATQQFQEKLVARLNLTEIIVCELGPVVGAHGGPGIVGLALWSRGD